MGFFQEFAIQPASKRFRSEYRLAVAKQQLGWGLPFLGVVTALLGLLAWASNNSFLSEQLLPFFLTPLFMGTYALVAPKLSDNAASYIYALTTFLVLEPFLLAQEFYPDEALFLFVHVLAISLMSLSLSWRSILIGFALLTTTDLLVHNLLLSAAEPDPTNALFSLFSVMISAGLLAIRIRTVEGQADLARTIEKLSISDPLTSIFNRRGLLKNAEKLVAKARETNQRLVVSILDIDGLKHINDVHGHEVGDRAIVFVAQQLERFAGKDALVGRLGGDEFAVIRIGTLEDQRRQSSMALDAIARESLAAVGLEVKVSNGSEDVEPEESKLAQAMMRADSELYETRRYVRNSETNKKPEKL